MAVTVDGHKIYCDSKECAIDILKNPKKSIERIEKLKSLTGKKLEAYVAKLPKKSVCGCSAAVEHDHSTCSDEHGEAEGEHKAEKDEHGHAAGECDDEHGEAEGDHKAEKDEHGHAAGECTDDKDEHGHVEGEAGGDKDKPGHVEGEDSGEKEEDHSGHDH